MTADARRDEALRLVGEAIAKAERIVELGSPHEEPWYRVGDTSITTHWTAFAESAPEDADFIATNSPQTMLRLHRANKALLDAGVVVLAEGVAEKVREAQERALLDAADAIELPSLDDYANTPTDAEAAAKAWLCRRARIYADPPAPHGDAEGYVCEVCGCWNATGQPCKYEDEHPREDETHG